MRRITVQVPDDLAKPERLDKLLTQLIEANQRQSNDPEIRLLSRSQLGRLIVDGNITVDGKVIVAASHRVKPGEMIVVELPDARSLKVAPDPKVDFKIVFRDADILVVDKPAGVVVHPGAGNFEGTLVSGLVHYLGDSLPELAGAFRPGIVHRLDKDTSGLMVIALTELAWTELVRQFKPPRTIERSYLAVTLTAPKRGKGSIVNTSGDGGTISLPIGRDVNNRVKMAPTSDRGKEAVTHWSVERELKRGLILRCKLETGRTHQIRVHLAATGAPIAGDAVYGAKLASVKPELRKLIKPLARQALHAQSLSFLHPRTGERISFTSDLALDIVDLIERLER